MTLATRCPQCGTTFRVVSDQLKLRKGLVKCGKCLHVFNGVEFLHYFSEAAPAAAPPATAASPAAPEPEFLGTGDAHAEGSTRAPATLAPASIPAMPGSTVASITVAADSAFDTTAAHAVTAHDDASAKYGAPSTLGSESSEAGAAPAPAPEFEPPVAPAAPTVDEPAASGEPAPTPAQPELVPPVADAGTACVEEPSPTATNTAWAAPAEPQSAPSTEEPDSAQATPIDLAPAPPTHESAFAVEPDEPRAPASPAEPALPAASTPTEIEQARAEIRALEAAVRARAAAARAAGDGSALAPLTLLDIAPRQGPEAGEAPRIDAFEELPAFLRDKRRAPPWVRALVACASIVALLGLAAQAAYVYRAELAAYLPAARAPLEAVCAALPDTARCSVDLPRHITQLRVTGADLQAKTGGSFDLVVGIHNDGSLAQAYPTLDVILTDMRNQLVIRRSIAPADYLRTHGDSTARLAAGLAPGGEDTLTIPLRIADESVVGYTVGIFYP